MTPLSISTGQTFTNCPDGTMIVHGCATADNVQVNRAGDSEDDFVGSDGVELRPGDAAVTFRKWQDGDDRATYWPDGPGGTSAYAEANAVVCVPWKPQSVPVFRPPCVGRATNPIVAFFRNNPIQHVQIDYRKIPTVLPIPPGFNYEALIQRFEKFSGDIRSGWNTAALTPGLQFQQYGTYVASEVSIALCTLCMGIPKLWKRRLAVALVQRGIDLVGSYADGRQTWMVDGGHMWGRWPVVLLTGHLLGVREIMAPSSEVAAQFPENRAFYKSKSAWWCGFEWGWRRHWTDTEWLWRHPSTWTTDERGERWRMHYLPDVLGAHVGTLHALALMGIEGYINDGLTAAMEDWMDPLPAKAAADLQANGCGFIAERWGTSYEIGGVPQMCAKLWRGDY